MEGGMVAVVQGLQDAGLAVTLLSKYRPPGRSVLADIVGSASRSHDEEAFIGSLRKYPISPVRSRSADLIERMLSYTQYKNGARHSFTRSAKSLPSKEAAKHLHVDEIPTRDTGMATNDTRPNFGYKRDVELIPVPMSNRKSRYEHQIGMYDYLKSNHKDKKLKGSEVRYLTNVKQCLRERLRQLCDEEATTICPKIQNRYSQHRKQYHRTESSHKCQKINYCKKLEKCTECKASMTQDSSQNEIHVSPSTSRDHRESRGDRLSSSFKPSKACYCNRGPCECGTQPSRSILKPNLTSEVKEGKRCLSICDYECSKTEDLYNKQLTDIVVNWLKELPVYANFSARDTMKRDEIINQFIDAIRKLKRDHKYFEKVEDEIRKCLKVLPMWRPENKADQESFENQLALSLIQKIKSITNEVSKFKDEISEWIDTIPFSHDLIDKENIVDELHEKLKTIAQNQQLSGKDYKDALKSEIAKTLNDLPIKYAGSKTTVINNIADNLVEKLYSLPLEESLTPKRDIKNVVLSWIKNIPQISDNINLNLNDDDQDLVNDLITRLNNLEKTDNKEQISDVISNWLNSVEEHKKCRIDHSTRSALTNQLIEQLINPQEIPRTRENLNNVVQKWFDDIPNTLGLHYIDNQSDLEMLVSKLQDLQTIENDENRQNTMRQEIMKWLQNMQRKGGRYVDSGTQENLVNKLLNMMQDECSIQRNVPENGLITQNIWKWLESQPEFKQDNSSEYRDMVIELSEKLQNIIDKKGEITEYDVQAEITNWFEKLSKERGIHVDPINRKKLEDKLMSSINPVKRRKNWEKKNIQDILRKEVSDIINDTVIVLEENAKKQLKDQIVEVLHQDWNDIHSTKTSKPISKIINILKQATNLTEEHITNMTQKIIDRVKQAALLNLDTKQEGPIILDNNSKEKLKSKVESILNNLPLKNKHQVRDEITNALLNNFENDIIDSAFDVIYEVLKNTNVSETEAREITNKILDISNQLRNEVIDTTYKSPSYGSAESLWMQKQMFMQRLEREITDFMEKVLSESSSFYKDTHTGGTFKTESLEQSINYNKFKSIPVKTSTPTKSDGGRYMNIETHYKNQIKELIKSWITNLGIDDIADESFKEEMAHDIAADIIDRQRYIQLSKMKRSSQEEMEHLKYQVFKWTSKLPNLIDLSSKTAEIKKLLNSLEALDIPNLIREANGRHSMVDKNVDKGNATTQDTDNFIEEHFYGDIWNWLNEKRSLKPRSSEDRRMMEDLIRELSRKLKNIISLDVNTYDRDVENLCKDEIVNYLKKLNQHIYSSEEQLEHRASDLISNLKNFDYFANNLKESQEAAKELRKQNAIKDAVQSWCQKLPLKKGKTFDDIKHIAENLAEAVSRYLMVTDMENINTFMDEILNNLKKLPLQFDKEDSKCLPEATEKLIETLKGVLNDNEKYYSSQVDHTVRKPAFKKAAEIMYDNIQNWCEKLPLDLGITNENIEQINTIKQNIAGKLLKKVGELNLDPEIFHDDYLYEDVLSDEIEKILNMLPKSKELEEQLPSLKENLMKDLLEVKEKMRNEMAGFAYKQQLRDAISKTLSSIGLPVTEETPFEVLKDNLADAFISLHYVADDEELRRKFKDKIFNEVNKFCDDYLKRNPAAPLNAQELNRELYKALKKVPVPKDESMRREVEQIRVKDIVADWVKDLPLEESPSPVQMNKMISLIAKKMHEIENEAEFNPDMDIDETMNNEISKWLKKFKLKTDNESAIEDIKKKLIEKMKTTKLSRKLDESTIRTSINYVDLTSDLDDSPLYPPSNLSAEDRAHLQRIRDRTSIERTILKPDDKKDASVSPVPIATGIQTEEKRAPDIYQRISQNASIQTIIRDAEPPVSITPQVIVKEYYWDSRASPPIQRSGSILSNMPPMTHLAGNIQQQTPKETPQVSTSSQTKPLPESKATITQETSIGQVVKLRIQSDGTGTATQRPCLSKATATTQEISNEINIESQIGHDNTDDYLQLNLRKRPEIKCKPCRGRAVLTGEYNDLEVGTSKALQQTRPCQQIDQDKERVETDRTGDRNYLIDQDVCAPCFRRPIYQTPTKDVECQPKRKKKNQPCSCRNPMLTKCTIRPQSPCHSHLSNKSCYVSKKHCPKCWDGFCPHPSYLYFRQD